MANIVFYRYYTENMSFLATTGKCMSIDSFEPDRNADDLIHDSELNSANNFKRSCSSISNSKQLEKFRQEFINKPLYRSEESEDLVMNFNTIKLKRTLEFENLRMDIVDDI
ncbi:hypothetical protein GJ496_010696 [Pomphorhynchus laevis]|nr:hypothetical protein GJ496_010696 [Pomphorhynchus laevis]